MNEKVVIAIARYYRGFIIFRTEAGCCIFTEGGLKHDFLDTAEAESFVDAFIVAALRTLCIGLSPVQ